MTSRTKGPHHPQHPDFQLGREASDWLVRLQDPQPAADDPYFDPETRDAAFLEWLARSAEHVRMFLDTRETYERLGQIDAQGLIKIRDLLGESHKDVIRVADRARRSGRALPPKKPGVTGQSGRSWRRFAHLLRSRRAVVSASLAVVAIVGGMAALHYPAVTVSTFLYSTAIGERKVVTLEDGTTLTLNTDTRVTVTYEPHLREVHLASGEVLFDVQHDDNRPFRVISNDVSIEDLGTEFDVYRQDAHTRVAVIRGRVQLNCDCASLDGTLVTKKDASDESPANSNRALTWITLSRGDQAEVTRGPEGAILAQRHVSGQQLTRSVAWKGGILWFENQTLAEAVTELNRYSTRRLVIADADIANYRVEGQFTAADMEAAVDLLRETFDIRVLPPDPKDPMAIRLGKLR